MKLKYVDSQKDLVDCLRVRIEVFVKEQEIDIDLELDQEDATCRHYALINDDEKVIGTCRLLHEGEVVHIGRVAVLKNERKNGAGRFMIGEVEKVCKQLGYQKIVLGAQCSAIEFYEKCGFHTYGDLYLDADIDHKMMEKYL